MILIAFAVLVGTLKVRLDPQFWLFVWLNLISFLRQAFGQRLPGRQTHYLGQLHHKQGKHVLHILYTSTDVIWVGQCQENTHHWVLRHKLKCCNIIPRQPDPL